MAKRRSGRTSNAFRRVMGAMKRGELRNSAGDPVTNRDRAMEIAFSKERRAFRRRSPNNE